MTSSMDTVPFTVGSQGTSKERVFKQVVFPGDMTEYRLRVIQHGGAPESMVLQRKVDTGHVSANPSQEVYRVKAVLNQKVSGVGESMWLTMVPATDHPVLSLNQFRVRGISSVGYRSKWAYSQLKDESGETIPFELLYDLMDMLLMTRDSGVETLISSILEDAQKSIRHKEQARFDFTLGRDEEADYGFEEKAGLGSDPSQHVSEEWMVKNQEMMKLISQHLSAEFNESFMSSSKEFSEIMKLYYTSDVFKQRSGDLATIVLESFIEDSLDRIIRKSYIEVIADNGENQQVFLGSEYQLDVKQEILKAAYNLVPRDDFVLKANSTVKLIMGPAASEIFNYEVMEKISADVRFFKNLLQEEIHVGAVENLNILYKMFIEEALTPSLIFSQVALLIESSLDDIADTKAQNASIIEYEMYQDDYKVKNLLARDIATDLIIGDQHAVIDSFLVKMIEKMVGRIESRVNLLVQYEMLEVFDYLSAIGEQIRHRYKAYQEGIQESLTVSASDASRVDPRPNQSFGEEFGTSSEDHVYMTPTGRPEIEEPAILTFIDLINLSPKQRPNLSDEIPISAIDMMESRLKIAQRMNELYLVTCGESLNSILKKTPHLGEDTVLDASDEMKVRYHLHPSDQRARWLIESIGSEIHSGLEDVFRIKGVEKVRYALGNGFDTGWPIGEFILGTNTLKGAQ